MSQSIFCFERSYTLFSKFLWKAQTKEAISVQIKTIFMSLGHGSFTALQAWTTACIISDVFFLKKGLMEVRIYFLLLLLSVVLRGIFLLGEEHMSLKVSSLVKGSLLDRMMEHASKLGPAVMIHEDRGAFFTLLSQGLSTMDAYFCRYLPQLFKSTLIPILYLIIAFPFDGITGLIFLITAPLIPFFMMLIGKWSKKMKNSSWEALSRMGGYLQDVLAGLGTLRNWNQEYNKEKQIRKVSEDFRLSTIKTLRVAFLSALTLEILTTISIALVAVGLGVRLAEGEIPFRPALFLILLAPEFYQPLRMLGQQYHNSQNAILVANDILAFLNKTASPMAPPKNREENLSPPAIEVKNLSFSYEEEIHAIHHLNLTLEAGKIYALVGHSGAGKTTLLRLLMGSLTPDQGEILVDGLPFHGWDGLSFIPAQPYFFKGSILENITLGREISEETVKKVCQEIGAESFILNLPQGYHTLIGQQGINLSGGQGQLLSIARAMVSHSRILLCDEATGSLDPASEAVVQNAMEKLYKNKTVIISAHRLHTLHMVDQVIMLQEGKLLQKGSFHELSSDSESPFSKLLQKGLVE